MAKAKTGDTPKQCAITREQFKAGAKPMTVIINGVTMIAGVKEFSTGGLGWFTSEKIVVEIGGVPVKVQVGLNLSVVNSKEAK